MREKDRGGAYATFSRGDDFLRGEKAVYEHCGQGVAVHVATV
jgi:hypothetical protein